MVKVITYGTYDLLHYGHVRLLERAKELGDYLIVGVTADDFDKVRGKINVQQSLMERVEAVRATGIADKIIIEEYEGQKIDDIKRYDVDIFTVGSDWVGKFDYLNEYCKVIYLERTQGVSSSELRTEKRLIRLGLVGDSIFLNKLFRESKYVNGIEVSGITTCKLDIMPVGSNLPILSYSELLNYSDAVYIRTQPQFHYNAIKEALKNGKHVLCESPLTIRTDEAEELYKLAKVNNLILMDSLKTAYATAFLRLILLVKAGKIGRVVSLDATCTSLRVHEGKERTDWRGFYEWFPTAVLPAFKLFGVEIKDVRIITKNSESETQNEIFSKIELIYDHAVATIRIGDGIKSEGELIISGTEGYIYVPAPWWKTDYFEIRYENQNDNKRYFYQLDGEGIRYELVAFVNAIEKKNRMYNNVSEKESIKMCEIAEFYENKTNVIVI